MRKEYTPAILMYVVSALFFIAAVLGAINDNVMWATWLSLGSLWMILASSKLTSIGKQLREEDEREEENKE